MVRRRTLLPVILALLAACGDRGSLIDPPPPTTADRNPVLFVHGWQGTASHFNALAAYLEALGWTDDDLHQWSYDSNNSNRDIADNLAGAVDDLLRQTGAQRVDIVTHSMGGLSSRHYLKFLDGIDKVDAWVSLAGPNHGTRLASLCSEVPCLEMRPESAFLTELNLGDETPGEVRYATWWSECDEAIDPVESVVLEGARNTQTSCLDHMQILSDPIVHGQVQDWIAEGDN